MFFFNVLPGWKVYWLVGVVSLCSLILVLDKGFDNRRFYWFGSGEPCGKRIFVRSIVVAVVVFCLVLWLHPRELFGFPVHRPWIWLMVMCFYPLVSAYPQEIAYRAFLFRRYEKLFGSGNVMVAASTVAFGFLHIMYDHPLSVLLTLGGGYLMADTYRRSRSLLWVALEHAIYGLIVFTIGLGMYFYEGRPTP